MRIIYRSNPDVKRGSGKEGVTLATPSFPGTVYLMPAARSASTVAGAAKARGPAGTLRPLCPQRETGAAGRLA